MVELNKKYLIKRRKFGVVNWVGFKSLWLKECNRFIAVWQQTLLSPLVSSLLFLSVLSKRNFKRSVDMNQLRATRAN